MNDRELLRWAWVKLGVDNTAQCCNVASTPITPGDTQ